MTSPRAASEPRPALPHRPSFLSRRTLLRRACLVAGTVPLAAAIDGVAITPRRLVTSTHSFGQAASTDRLRIVQVSDLHVHGIGTLERQLLKQLHEAQADLIVITGDSIDQAESLPLLDRLLGDFPRSPRVLAILGNWEYRSGVTPGQFARTYARHGIELLVNQSIEVEHQGRTIRVTGLDDILYSRPAAATAIGAGRPLDHHLVLAHCPISRDTLGLPPEHPASFVLSGHTHGGQVAPFGVATILPPGCGRYVAGWYRDADGPPLYVSRGIGTSLLPIRLGATPELVRIDWGLEDPLQFSAA
ncbi:MAG: metallophosphoesterase [Planctomycetia bacterium]|nr:metallophosphoesterase [Planctomycetia bacterium]